ncbi:hypothetical protein [Clostridium magnum]|uniref:Uncharacterized protein n=1 Tax=Clostridium magnum DSM 2767 TaxID=1121326 RepID=A0A161WQ84_9CLOT|nr:hypothetical protein [Clostridium magnum]KZL88788.1 hypothetical protein CLMAG_58810 [Clostridium magnum DSM 2767]
MFKYNDIKNDCKIPEGRYQNHILNAFNTINKIIEDIDIMFGFVKNYDPIISTNTSTKNDDPINVKIILLLKIK